MCILQASLQAPALPKPPHLKLEDEMLKVEEMLHHFCQICASALLDSRAISVRLYINILLQYYL